MLDRNNPMRKRAHSKSQAGFSLLELLIVCALLTIIMGAIFAQINQAQQNSAAEQMKLDLFQESREFMDQMSRDLRAAGYPNPHNFSGNPVGSLGDIEPYSSQEAVGLVKIDVGTLYFESSVDGCSSTASGNACNVSVIRYDLVTTGPGCPCLTRSQTPKATADPVNGQSDTQQTEVQNVLNGTTGDPIFQAYYSDGTPVTPLPMDMYGSCAGVPCLANVNSIAITLKVQSPYLDPKTGQKPTMTLMSNVRLNNCSSAYLGGLGTVMGCR